MSTEKNFKMKKCLTMWLKKGQKGSYLTGVPEGAKDHLFGRIYKNKKNLKAPDIKIAITSKDASGKTLYQDVCSLWVNTSESGIKYCSGTYEEKRVVGFFVPTAKPDSKIPYLNVYFSEDLPKDQEKQAAVKSVTEDEGVPF